jgi:iron complex transport system substrate-binding protein
MAIPLFALVAALSNPRIKPPVASGALHDMHGRAVPVTAPAQRVVTFPPMLWVYLVMDGGAEHILATSRYQLDDIRNGLLRHIFPGAVNLPVALTGLGAIPGDPEQVLVMRADAVFSWSQFSDSLKKIGAPLVQVDPNPSGNERDAEALWRLAGAVAGKSARVEQLIVRTSQERSRVMASVAGQRGHPRALYVYGTDLFTVASGKARESQMLESVGAVNVASGLSGSRLTKEQLLQLAPDIIVISGFDKGNGVRALYDDPAFRGLPAVRAKRVYRIPSGGTRTASVIEDPLTLQWLAELMHLGSMPREYRNRLRETYVEVSGVTLSDDAIDENLRLDENLGSAGYDHFLRLGTPLHVIVQ